VVTRATPSREELLAILDEVKDPEVPAVSVVELGIVRDVAATQAGVEVTITPTYSGCPAMREIESDIREALAAGVAERDELVSLERRARRVRCPFCKSSDTERKSEFGSTACKSIWFCRSCRQPFEEFKAI
jgi:ring-1,2-phenylacetyl-CoA epoxidase subunit PaaD